MKCEIDARGLACPQPVVLTKNKMNDCNQIEILVDNETAKENLKRLASSSGWTFEVSVNDDYFKILLKARELNTSADSQKISSPCSDEGSVFVFSSDRMGKGDDELGAILMKAFIHTLAGLEPEPSKLLFYNSGVKLAAEGSGVVDDLQLIQEKGIEILICGTCVNYFNIGDKIKTGIISNMFDILNAMNGSTRIINP